MALVKFGGGIVQMTGSIAGNTFARNRYGNYVRARTKPINPNTSRQQAVRSVITQLTTRWTNTVTEIQRTAWQLYAESVEMKNRLGEVVNLSGFNHFIRGNAARRQMTTPIIDDGPTDFSLPEGDASFEVAISAATNEASITFNAEMDWVNLDDAAMIVSMGRPQSPSVNFFNGPWREAGVIEGNTLTPPTSPETMTCPWIATEGQTVYFRARIALADGRLSNFFRCSCTVAV